MQRKMLTVNGKTLEEVEILLREPFPDSELDTRSGYLYIPIECYENRLDTVVGILNYNLDCSEAEFKHVNESTVVVVNMSIEIYSDNGEIILRKSAYGGANVILLNENEKKKENNNQNEKKPKSLKNDIDIAVSEAFKKVCKKLGIGLEQMRSQKKENKRKASSSSDAINGNQTDASNQLFRIKFITRMSSGNGLYKADVIDIDTGEKLIFIIFKREFPLIEEHIAMPEFISAYGRDTEFTFYGFRKDFNGQTQIIFSKPSVKA